MGVVRLTPCPAEGLLVAQPVVRATESAPALTVRGRDGELTVLGQHLDQLLSGVGTVVLVEGGAGMGKSRLLREAAERARRLSIRVGCGAADPSDTVVQLSVLLEALFEGGSPILERNALGDAHASPEQRYWLLQDLEALLEGAALEAPLLVCLDDLQWADSGTSAALRALTARLATVPIGWLVAFRPGQGPLHLRSALDSLELRGAAKMVLGPLEQAGVAEVTADALGAEPDGEVLRMAERAAGSPFLLVELLSGLHPARSARSAGAVRIQIRGHVHDDVASRQPSLAGAVDICVAALAEADVTANVVMPAAEILRDVIVVAVRLVGIPSAERKWTRHGTGRPVASSTTLTCTPLRPSSASSSETWPARPPVTFHVAPAHPAEFVAAPPDRDGGRRQRGDRRIRGRSFGRSPAGPVVLAGQRLRIGRDTPVHADIEDAAPPVLRHQPHRARRRADERVLIKVAGRDAGDDESRAARDELDPFDRSFRMRIFPAPQVVPGGHPMSCSARRAPASPQLPAKRGRL